MSYILLRAFVKKFDSYRAIEQKTIVEVIDDIKKYFETNQASHGLRIKKLFGKIYEARINIHLRIAFFRNKDVVKFFCLGNHSDIQRCLKSFRKLLK
ncbi:MAG: hypothetical protein KKC11_07385 [Candidatus Omnitrophica bacterium]|nr:hypothetical protein [Candidatus Omnitrophota bacterium]MBU1134207.1 hypothetical protein [Candidatus Omnitrophota bacterium]MBU1367574.1 hypothetical protein [Candidatus Omnitrophota bacterium]MBU1810337.1 hypothetical protein [Candidatus Omnitrophota bacterium]MBU2436125.1 hypothetical protein [Candidatus Omnitrophota bacterium]